MSLIFQGHCDFSELLGVLADIPFRYSLRMDENRKMDGIALRYRFGYENGISGDDISERIGDEPCSVLETMAALCLRCAEQIIDADISACTELMFRDMLHSLGLDGQVDGVIDIPVVRRVVRRFLDRRYSADGRGGLFTVSCPGRDMRTTEIWYQMCLYLGERMKN